MSLSAVLRQPLVLAGIAVFAIAPSQPAQSLVHYAPGTHRYHLIAVITRSQDQNGQRSEARITNEQQVSVKLAPHGRDTLDFSYVIDSSRLSSEPPAQLPDVSRMRGTRVSGSMSASGKVFALTSSAEKNDPEAQNVVEGMSRFLVAVPAGATVGSKWTDTTLNTVNQNGANLHLSTITTSTVLSDTSYHGQRAHRVARSSVLSLSGTQSQAGIALKVEGQGSGDGMYYIGATGVYLGSNGTQRMQMTVTRLDTNESVPVLQTVSSKVELLTP